MCLNCCVFQPQNILFDEKSGQVKVSDFGLATAINGDGMDFSCGHQSTVLQRTVNKGTKLYMSPEQVKKTCLVVIMMNELMKLNE